MLSIALREPGDQRLSPRPHFNPRLLDFYSTGAGAPPPARTDADTARRIRMSATRCGRRRFSAGAGPHRLHPNAADARWGPRAAAWPQARLADRPDPHGPPDLPGLRDPPDPPGLPGLPDPPDPPDPPGRLSFHWRRGPPPARTDADASTAALLGR